MEKPVHSRESAAKMKTQISHSAQTETQTIQAITDQHQLSESVAEVSKAAKSQIKKGAGPLFHRHYFAALSSDLSQQKKVLTEITNDLSAFCPSLMARFEKSKGAEEFLLGDEYCVHITGPFPAKVRVDEITESGFTLTTLDDHLEAGQIAFYFDEAGFHIDSWARSRNELIDFLYDKAPVVRYMQSLMWEHFCEEVAQRLSPGEKPNVTIETERYELSTKGQLSHVFQAWGSFFKSIASIIVRN